VAKIPTLQTFGQRVMIDYQAKADAASGTSSYLIWLDRRTSRSNMLL
jgi:hypothetical protein